MSKGVLKKSVALFLTLAMVLASGIMFTNTYMPLFAASEGIYLEADNYLEVAPMEDIQIFTIWFDNELPLDENGYIDLSFINFDEILAPDLDNSASMAKYAAMGLRIEIENIDEQQLREILDFKFSVETPDVTNQL